jgi:CRISPR-associated endoribonuclease Cas6
MRIRLTLRPLQQKTVIPINYQYPLSAAIYKILAQASDGYAAFLHDTGYRAATGRLMKMFTFSQLQIPNRRINKHNKTIAGSNHPWSLFVGSPMHEEFVQNFVLGLFESNKLAIAGKDFHMAFQIETVETLPVPEFNEQVRFKCLSPFTASTMIEENGRLKTRYLLPDDPNLSQAIRQNLLHKYKIVHQKDPGNNMLQLNFDEKDTPKTKLITIKEGTKEETRRRAIMSYFSLAGSPELMHIAWECGIGEANSQGFGMIEVI